MTIVTISSELEWRSVRDKFALRSDAPAKLYRRAMSVLAAQQAVGADTCRLYYVYDNGTLGAQYEHVGHLIVDTSHSPKGLLILSLDATAASAAQSALLIVALLEKARRLALKHKCRYIHVPCPKTDLYAALGRYLAKRARSINNDADGLPVLWHELDIAALHIR